MAMLAIVIAGLFEVGFALCLKASDNFTQPLPTLGFFGFAAVSLWLLNWSLRDVPIGTAYAVWSGIGAVGTAILGIALFSDPLTAARLAGIGLIISGVIVLNLFSGSAAH